MAAKASRRMQPTLVRFGPDLHTQLKEAAAEAGISVAQYVREAVVARIAHDAARGPAPSAQARAVRSRSETTREESAALRAESEQAARRARQLSAKNPS